MHGALLERMLDGMSWVYAAMHLQIPVCHLVQLSSEGPAQSDNWVNINRQSLFQWLPMLI